MSPIPQQAKISHFFLSTKKCLTCFLTLDFPCSVLTFCFAQIYNSIINCAYSNSITITCANSTHFYALILLKRREIEKQYLHCLVSMPFWHLATQITIRHALTHFTRCSLVTVSFQISWDLLSSNIIGCHATWLFINPTSLFIISGNM